MTDETLLREALKALERLLQKFHIETDCTDGAHWAECDHAQDIVEALEERLLTS